MPIHADIEQKFRNILSILDYNFYHISFSRNFCNHHPYLITYDTKDYEFNENTNSWTIIIYINREPKSNYQIPYNKTDLQRIYVSKSRYFIKYFYVTKNKKDYLETELKKYLNFYNFSRCVTKNDTEKNVLFKHINSIILVKSKFNEQLIKIIINKW